MQDCDTKIRAMAYSDLAMVRAWRNHTDIRRYMFNTQKITEAEHSEWFKKGKDDPFRQLLIAEDRSGPFGYVQFGGVQVGGVADWGFYICPDAPKGSGAKLGRSAIHFAFTTLELHKICGQVVQSNVASLAFHRKMGFCEEGTLREQQIIDNVYHTIICFGLLKAEWEAIRD